MAAALTPVECPVGDPPITPNLAPLAVDETESGLFPCSLGTDDEVEVPGMIPPLLTLLLDVEMAMV